MISCFASNVTRCLTKKRLPGSLRQSSIDRDHTVRTQVEQGGGKPTSIMLPNVIGISERIRKASERCLIFRCMLTKVKDPLPANKHTSFTNCFAHVERSTSERPRGTLRMESSNRRAHLVRRPSNRLGKHENSTAH